MSLFLCCTKSVNKDGNVFTNIKPTLELTDDEFLEIYEDDKRFEPRGTIQVTHSSNSENELFELDPERFADNKYTVFDTNDEFLNSLYKKDDGTKKLWWQDFRNHSNPLNRDNRFCEVIEIETSNLQIKHIQKIVHYMSSDPVTKNVYLKIDDKLAGPFKWTSNENEYVFTVANVTDEKSYYYKLYNYCDFEYQPDILYFKDVYNNSKGILYLSKNVDDYECELCDGITDDGLKNILTSIISKNSDLSRNDKKVLKNEINKLSTIEINQERKDRILQLLSNEDIFNQIIDDIPRIVINTPNFIEKVAGVLYENENYRELIENSEVFNEKANKFIKKDEEIKRFVDKIKQLEDENNNLTEQCNSTTTYSGDIEQNEQYAQLKISCNNLKEENEKLSNKINEYDHINKSIHELQKQEKEIKESRKFWEKEVDDLKVKFNNAKENAYKNLYQDTYNGEIANIMLEEANAYKNNKETENIENRCIENLDNINLLNEENIIEYVYEELEKLNRKEEKKDIANVLLCLSLGFLTILAGEPGSGKTSLANLISKVLGLNNYNNERFIQISVEKGWTSKRDLIGYYNPLNNRFESNDNRFSTALKLLDCENKMNKNTYPYVVLLDEANLSQMEYYWADFMTLCDFDNPNRSIMLSQDNIVTIPNTLRFIATMNLDSTTETLSPRLIDRAWIIKLENNFDYDDFDYVDSSINLKGQYNTISLDTLHSAFDNNEEHLSLGVHNKLVDIAKRFQGQNCKLSQRIINDITKYCLCGNSVFAKLNENSAYYALDYAIAQKVLPKIDGTGDNYKKFIEELLSLCTEFDMPVCNRILKNILEKGKRNMDYYNFFI